MNTEEIFFAALERSTPDERRAFLDGVCVAAPAVREEVERMLASHEEGASFLEDGAFAPEATAAVAIDKEVLGQLIGPYKLLQQIGHGGFGVVYMAQQTEPIKRKVALKIIKPGMDTKEVIARFEAERQALALMSHPNIAKVLDAGTTSSGHPYFVMELVNGIPITDYCDTNHLPTKERLELFTEVCKAVQHAHQKGIIHRDLKPSNIMVTLHDGKPVPRVIDFGVAKALNQQLTDQTMFTRYGQVIGTPQYMSPEQAEMSGLDIDTRSDVYSLGVLLYELMTGQPPFTADELRQAGYDEMRRLIREKEPARPSLMLKTLDADTATAVAQHRRCKLDVLGRALAGEVDWIVLKALDKDRSRRYVTAAAFAEDVEHYLNDQTVLASPPTFAYRARKWTKKNRLTVTVATVVLLSLIGGLALAINGLLVAENERRFALVARMESEQAKQEALLEREKAEQQRALAQSEAGNTKRTLELVLELLSRSGTDPATGQEFTVSQALDRLSERVNEEADLPAATAAELQLGLAQAFQSSGQRDRALKHFEIAFDLGVNAAWPASDKRLAEARRESAYLAGSIERLQTAVEEDREVEGELPLIRSLTRLGSLAYDKGKNEIATAVLEEAIGLFPEEPAMVDFVAMPHLILADVLLTEGNDEAAEQVRQQGVDIAKACFTDDDRAWYRMSHRLSSIGEFTAAENAYDVAEQCERSVDAAWLKRMGHAFRRDGDFELADRSYASGYEVAATQANTDAMIWSLLNRGRVRFHAHDFQRAEEHYKQAIGVVLQDSERVLQSHFWTYFEYANLLYGTGKREEATLQLTAALKYMDDHPGLHSEAEGTLNWFLCMAMLGRINEIEDDLRVFLSTDETNAKYHPFIIDRAIVATPSFEFENLDLIEQREKVSEMRGAYEAAYFHFCEDDYVDWMAGKSQLDRAEEFMRAMVEKRDSEFHPTNPDRAWTRKRLARILLMKDSKNEEAVRLIQEAIAILKPNAFVPQERIDELHEMIAHAESTSEE